MVSLEQVQASNALISASLPAGLTAVFVGATSGIGEETVKNLVKNVIKPRIYIVGRSQSAASRILAECQTLNPDGHYVFIQEDISLIRNVDKVCNEIKVNETTIDLLFLSQGVAAFGRQQTSEELHLLTALVYYSRIRFIKNLLPLLRKSLSLRRIIAIAGGGLEGEIERSDFQALLIPVDDIRGHLSTLLTLGLEAVGREAPEVSIIHSYPGTVRTRLFDGMHQERLQNLNFIPIEECADRHLYLATSARYPAAESAGSSMIPLRDVAEVALSTTGRVGGGVYSVGQTCDNLSVEVIERLAAYRAEGMVDEISAHTSHEFSRILA